MSYFLYLKTLLKIWSSIISALKLIAFELNIFIRKLEVYFFIIVVKVLKLFAIRLIDYLSLYYLPFVKSSIIVIETEISRKSNQSQIKIWNLSQSEIKLKLRSRESEIREK